MRQPLPSSRQTSVLPRELALQNEGPDVLKRPAIMTHGASRWNEKFKTVIGQPIGCKAPFGFDI